ncbi:ABC transporter substrate-binding protein [Actinopolymorpha alba]|uniref:ABC transporter substrate-binding protein n=1 Tax=Actinopolymorpha alba TaxID=533267 RepID=UPI0003655671|nr:extracellular solute-binding protein [Actinopolymorpha alba]
MKRRDLLRAAVAAAGASVLSGGLAACSSEEGNRTTPSTSLTYWDWYVSQAGWVDNELKLFDKAHPGPSIKRTTQVTDRYADLLALSVRSKNTPDVFMIPKLPALQEQVDKGWLLPLDKWATSQWQSRFPANQFVEGVNVFGGKVYTAPFAAPAPSLQLYCHHGAFKDAGLTNADGTIKLPKTWDDVTRAAEAITSKSGGKAYGLGFGNAQNFALAWWIDLFTRGAGSPGGTATMDYRVGRWTFASDRNYADFLTLLLDWKKRGFIYPSSMSISDEQARAFFSQGKFGMTVGGVWNQPTWTENKFTEYSLVTLPAPDGTPKAFFYGPPGGSFVAISAKASDPERAWAWLDWLYSKEAGKRWVEQGLGLSVYPDNNDPSLVKFEPFAEYVAMANTAFIGPTPTVRNPEVAKVTVNAVKPDINDVGAGLYTGQLKDVAKALSELQDRLNTAQDDAVKAAQAKGAKVSADDYVFKDWDPAKPYVHKPA